MKTITVAIIAFLFLQLTACSQNNDNRKTKSNTTNHIGGDCEGCEAIYESPIPFEKLPPTDTLPDFNSAGPKIFVSGTVYQQDGKTPAKDVIIYVYHTDQTGRYTANADAKGWEKRHGSIRGWMKTDKNGSYSFYTLRPAHYPGRDAPQHIHVTIKEPDKNEYYIEEYLFDDDPILPDSERNRKFRAGSGILKLTESNGIMQAKRDIILGLNIPGYPDEK